ncbi:MAG TPA: PAC2 family protein [Aggregatilinea sp.]|uniref:PAC2 family protein n=1 Tax=Aggregatilinea sp. TaxID=2806333 RepID=UPI002CF94249|nr:PAC2 family protein [Aggregatilinea sp.]HML21455.1 PAC2 family protein [Aggregatilinea sp.]
MPDTVELSERPEADEMVMIVGWRQWADAGSVSSALPQYLIQQSKARKIGTMRPDGFYLFQIPGTHDLVRPTVEFDEGYPRVLQTQHNEFHYVESGGRGVLIFLGDEPHMDVERYIGALLNTAESLHVSRIIGLGGVYGELPYAKERMISANYSLPALKEEVEALAVELSNYQGGASVGSFICRRAGDRGMEYVGLYAFVPTYDFSGISQVGNAIRIENDYMAWLGIVRRINHMLKTNFSLSDLEQKSQRLLDVMDEKIEDLERTSPELDLHAYFERLNEEFVEKTFDPLDDVWEDEIRRIFDEPEPPDEA